MLLFVFLKEMQKHRTQFIFIDENFVPKAK